MAMVTKTRIAKVDRIKVDIFHIQLNICHERNIN